MGVRPGQRYTCPSFAKETMHGAPCVEDGFAGKAKKSAQAQPAAPSAANAEAARTIAVGERGVIIHLGTEEFSDDFLPAGAAVGNPLYIREADNVLVLAAEALTAGVIEAGYAKFGRLESLAATGTGRCEINLNEKGNLPG